ncbi:hypothetical protein KKA53_04890 [Candidatus Dependentiae bacterium]|nr:hypothetical protein [Candidatus Dependentiae bacterium]
MREDLRARMNNASRRLGEARARYETPAEWDVLVKTCQEIGEAMLALQEKCQDASSVNARVFAEAEDQETMENRLDQDAPLSPGLDMILQFCRVAQDYFKGVRENLDGEDLMDWVKSAKSVLKR